MLYNPPGGHSYWLHRGANRQLWSNTARKFHFNQGSTAHFKNTREYLSGKKNQKNSTDVKKCFYLSDTSMKYKCSSVYLTRIQPNTQDIIVSDNTTNEQWHKDKCSDHKIFPYDNTASAFSSQYD